MCLTETNHLHKKGEAISTLSSPSQPHFHLHQCIHIYIEKPWGYDALLSHTGINPETLILTPFTVTQTRLLTYILLIPLNSLPPTLYNLSPAVMLPY